LFFIAVKLYHTTENHGTGFRQFHGLSFYLGTFATAPRSRLDGIDTIIRAHSRARMQTNLASSSNLLKRLELQVFLFYTKRKEKV